MTQNQRLRTEYSAETKFLPYLIAVNLTRRCNLKCAHCYLDAGGKEEYAT